MCYKNTGLTIRSYKTGQEEAIPVIPFHACCLEILVRFLTGSTDINALNKETLYNSLLDVAGKQSLNFDYRVRGQGRFWYCIPGEEVIYSSSFCCLVDTDISCLVFRGVSLGYPGTF